MKKRVIFAAALTLTMCAGWSFSKSFTTESKLSELQIENVEALAQSEGGSGGYIDPNDRYGYEFVYCYKNNQIVGGHCEEGGHPESICNVKKNFGKCN